MPAAIRYPCGAGDDAKPPMPDRMLDLAVRLSAPFDFVPVAPYAAVADLRVGELTNCPDAGRSKVTPPEARFLLGRFFERR